MAKRRRLRKCRICKKSPVWRGGDVFNPGPYCKKCYHKHISPSRKSRDDEQSVADDHADYLCGLWPVRPYDYDERLPDNYGERLPLMFYPYSGSLLGLPLGPDKDEWAWICRTARGDAEYRLEWSLPPESYPDEDDWEWICETFRYD